MSEDHKEEAPTQMPKKRGITSLTLGWLAERIRKTERIRESVDQGTYQVDSEKVAQSMLKSES